MENITLKHPFKSPDNGAEITSVEVHSAKVGDLVALAKMRNANQEEKLIELTRRCVKNLSPAEFNEIVVADFMAITENVNAGAGNFQKPNYAEDS